MKLDRPIDVPTIETRHRRIVTPLPHPDDLRLADELARYEPRSMNHQVPIVWDRAEGHQVFDAHGNCWLDLSAGIFVANAGHANPDVCDAIRKQADAKLLHNYTFPTRLRLALTRKLVEIGPPNMDRVFLLSTGSEATECVLKLTRMHGRRIDPRKIGVVVFERAFHGRTLGAQTISGDPALLEWVVHVDPEVYRIPYPTGFRCPWGPHENDLCDAGCFEKSLARLADGGVDLSTIAGFIMETFQGWGAVFPPNDFVRAMRTWCDANQALLSFDEVQAGFGRAGRLFGFEDFGAGADLVCCAKGITSGPPLACVLGPKHILDLAEPGAMSSTHGGSPIPAAAALANIEALDAGGIIERSIPVGETLGQRLRQVKARWPQHVRAVCGRGMVYGVVLYKPGTEEYDVEAANEIVDRCMLAGVLMIRTGCGTLKIAPPLVIPQDAVHEAADVLENVMSVVFDAPPTKANGPIYDP